MSFKEIIVKCKICGKIVKRKFPKDHNPDLDERSYCSSCETQNYIDEFNKGC